MEQQVVALAVDSCLYAPLYIAQEAGFWGDLPIVFGTLSRQPVEKHPVRDPRYLRAALDAMWIPLNSENPPLVTICDPMHALLHNATCDPTRRCHLIGSLIVRPACWFFNRTPDWDDFVANVRKVVEAEGATEREIAGRILTHPAGMTADTVARWTLLEKAEIQLPTLNVLIQPVDEPGQELLPFLVTQAQTPEQPNILGAVSLEFDRMSELVSRDRFVWGVPQHCSTIPELSSYLMTGVHVREKELSDHEEMLAQLIEGIELAIGLLKDRFDVAFSLLCQHYQRRWFQKPSPGLVSRPYLKPLAPMANPDRYRREMLKECSACYPKSVTSRELGKLVNATWGIYDRVQSDIVRATLKRESPPRPSALPQTVVRRRRSSFIAMCRAYTKHMVLVSKHPTTPEIVNWISNRSTINASSFRLVGGYLIGDELWLNQLRATLASVRDCKTHMDIHNQPVIFLVSGPPGCGKGTIVRAFLDDLQANGTICRQVFLDLSTRRDTSGENLRREVCQKLANGSGPTGVFIDECNKHELHEGVLGEFISLVSVSPELLGEHALTDDTGRRVVYFFGGTIPGSVDEVDSLVSRASKAGPDFVSRVKGSGKIISLSTPGPYDRVVRFMKACFVTEEGVRIPSAPVAMSRDLALWLATKELADPRTLNHLAATGLGSLLKSGSARTILDLEDVVNPQEAALFRLVYVEERTKLGDGPLHMIWDI